MGTHGSRLNDNSVRFIDRPLMTDWEHGFGTCAKCGTWNVYGEDCCECGIPQHGENFTPPDALEVAEERMHAAADRDADRSDE